MPLTFTDCSEDNARSLCQACPLLSVSKGVPRLVLYAASYLLLPADCRRMNGSITPVPDGWNTSVAKIAWLIVACPPVVRSLIVVAPCTLPVRLRQQIPTAHTVGFLNVTSLINILLIVGLLGTSREFFALKIQGSVACASRTAFTLSH